MPAGSDQLLTIPMCSQDCTTAVVAPLPIGSRESEAGLGAGVATRTRLSGVEANDITIVTHGDASHAALGAAFAYEKTRIVSPLARSCSVQTYGVRAEVGIGAGRLEQESVVGGVLGGNCTLGTRGINAHGGFGAGHARRISRVINTVVTNSRLQIDGRFAAAGIGVARTDNSPASVGDIACNTTVNGEMFSDGCGRVDLRALLNSSDIQPGNHSCSPAPPEPIDPAVVPPGPTTPAVVLPGVDVLPSAPLVPTTATTTDIVPPGLSLPSPTVVSILLATGATAALGGLVCCLVKKRNGRGRTDRG